jgi:formyltetrahydrofolate deformylase
MHRQFATITLIGDDQAGVIARITQLLFQLGANIEALEEQVSRGRFSMTLQASWPAVRFERTGVERRIRQEGDALGMETKIHFAPTGPQRLAIMVTREAHALEGLLAKSAQALGAQPVVVIGSRPILAKAAQQAGLPFIHVPFTDRARAERRVLAVLEKYDVNFIVLARFMKILSPDFVWRWKNKIINIHPSLLPAFPGAGAYRQAYERGVKVVGVTRSRRRPHHRAGSPPRPGGRTVCQHRQARAGLGNQMSPARRPRLHHPASGPPLGPGLWIKVGPQEKSKRRYRCPTPRSAAPACRINRRRLLLAGRLQARRR